MNRNTSLREVKGVGEKTGKLFWKLGIKTCGELLSYYPREYEQFLPPVKISELREGRTEAIFAKIVSRPTEKRVRNLSILNFICQDESGSVTLTFFNMGFMKSNLKVGESYVFRGTVQCKGARVFLDQPKVYSYSDYVGLSDTLLPKYSLTKGLTNQMILKSVRQVLANYTFEAEYYPQILMAKYDLISAKEAKQTIHFPAHKKELAAARKRLVFEEFFNFIYFMQMNKSLNSGLQNQYPFYDTADTVRFLEHLPFPLTNAQKKVWQEIKDDLGSNKCMNRLIQGDVGSGKTILAVLALLLTASNGYQGAFMAPTEVLAVQHYETIQNYVKQYGLCFSPVLLVGSMTQKEKREAYAKIASGNGNLIIGTHALIQEKVEYKSLALVVTDEQHRFGVRQREQLAEKGHTPHILVMSATPIPRTLAIILYGDLDISIVDEVPANRLPIKNCVVNLDYREKAYRFIASQVEQGRQVYVICPQVEEGEMEELENVVDYAAKLKEQLPPSIQVSYLHGKMRGADKNRIMEDFGTHKIDVLVSTTVIEVGINVPNATVMMIENAERFGLAQLHQLRGRVGRGEHQSYCIFISGNENKDSMERLQILERSNDGFFIASEDLRLRGPGDLFGVRQSGEFAFKMADIYSDAKILKDAADAVNYVLQIDPGQESEEFSPLYEHILNTPENSVDFRTI